MQIIELISMCALVVGAVGLATNLLQSRSNAKQTRAEWLSRLYGRYLEDAEMAEVFYKIEYKQFEYTDDSNFHGSSTERHLDRLLEHYEMIARVHDLGAITLSEVGGF